MRGGNAAAKAKSQGETAPQIGILWRRLDRWNWPSKREADGAQGKRPSWPTAQETLRMFSTVAAVPDVVEVVRSRRVECRSPFLRAVRRCARWPTRVVMIWAVRQSFGVVEARPSEGGRKNLELRRTGVPPNALSLIGTPRRPLRPTTNASGLQQRKYRRPRQGPSNSGDTRQRRHFSCTAVLLTAKYCLYDWAAMNAQPRCPAKAATPSLMALAT